jgi:shikimate kinase
MSEQTKNIILIGFMGCGKTTVGLRLSYRLRMPVEDTDKLIEKNTGKSISEIFATDGEEQFRRMETELLESISRRNYPRIISVGGGTPVNPQNRVLLKKCGKVIYLRIRPETVFERLKTDTTRPLLQCEEPLAKIKQLLDDRSEAYEECADLIIDADELSVDDIVNIIENDI